MFTSDNQPKNRKSRKGVPNRATSELRNNVNEIVEGEISHVKASLAELRKQNPSEYIKAVSMLLKFVLPTLKATHATIQTPNPISFKEMIRFDDV